jgi:putative hemolysin
LNSESDRGFRRKRKERSDQAAASEQARHIAENLENIDEVQVREVMTPRIDVEGLETPVSAADIAKAVRETGHLCYPVVLDDLDNAIGLLFIKDLLRSGKDMFEEGTSLSSLEISRRIRPALLIPESINVLEALETMREERRRVALVVDEYGGVAGLISTRDLIEPLVGDLVDELSEQEEPEAVRVDASRWLVQGQMAIDDLSESVGLDLPEGDYVTLGGFVLAQLGEIPEEGAEIDFEGWTLRIHAMDKRRIAEVIVRRPTVE